MPLDPQAKALLERNAAVPQNPNATLQERRAAMRARPSAPGPAVYRTEDRLLAGPGGPIPVRIYSPVGSGPFPALVWFHGGGWVLGDLEWSEGAARHLCVGANAVVVSVDYRLAPEHRFPAGLEDCYAATIWTVKNGAGWNVDPQRIAVGGDSAGGNLAAAVSLMAREKSGPRIAFQVLVYPVTDRDFTTRSYQDNGVGYGLGKDGMITNWNQYLAKDEDAKNPLAAPLQAKDLRRLPPALVITAEYDPLRDEGNAYAARLKEAGVPVVNTCYDGVTHGFFNQWAVLDKGKAAIAQACGALREAFAKQPVLTR
ncbi:MAG: alpha/beta hydrolase [Dehalococcoidia bacterium]|nr:alpha/beta hydrolase [Dehalococcoidia bacterium]